MSESIELVEISLNNKGEDIILNVDLNTANILLNGTVVGILMFDFKKHIFHRSKGVAKGGGRWARPTPESFWPTPE
jgi:hypothetical protein